MTVTHKPHRSRITPGDGDPRHGTLNGYTNLSCRCPCCRQAMATWQRKRRARRERTDRILWRSIVGGLIAAGLLEAVACVCFFAAMVTTPGPR